MPFKKGQSGNPAGPKAGYRQTLTNAFLKDMEADWRQHGADAIRASRENDPTGFLRVVAALVPKQIEAEVKHSFADYLRALDQPDATALADDPAGLREGSVAGHA